jgi:hypothetical protein
MTHSGKFKLFLSSWSVFILLTFISSALAQTTLTAKKGSAISLKSLSGSKPAPASPLSLTIGSVSEVTCYGYTNGAATVTASGGKPPYNYSWSGGQQTATAIGLTAGKYIVTVRDSVTTAKDSVVITQPDSLVDSLKIMNATCTGLSNGTATMYPKGGTAPYSYSWNCTPPQITQSAIGLPAGSYVATVTDANACSLNSTASILQPAGYIRHGAVGCNRKLTAVDSGGTGYYSWFWNTNPVQTTQSILVSTSGSYTVLVLDSVSQCTHSDTLTITVPLPPAIPVITLTGASLVSSVPVGDQWYLYGVPIAGATDSLFNPSVNGTYTVRVGVPPCTSVSAPFVLNSAGISVQGASLCFLLYPNPSSDWVMLELCDNAPKNMSVLSVCNNLGQEIKQIALPTSTGKSFGVDLTELANGIYFISIRNENKEITGRKKFVIQH